MMTIPPTTTIKRAAPRTSARLQTGTLWFRMILNAWVKGCGHQLGVNGSHPLGQGCLFDGLSDRRRQGTKDLLERRVLDQLGSNLSG